MAPIDVPLPPRNPSFDLDTQLSNSAIQNSTNLATTSTLTRTGSLVILPGLTSPGDLPSGTRPPYLGRPFVLLSTHDAVGLSTRSDSPFYPRHAVDQPTRSQLYPHAEFQYFNLGFEPDHPPSPPRPQPSPTMNDEWRLEV